MKLARDLQSGGVFSVSQAMTMTQPRAPLGNLLFILTTASLIAACGGGSSEPSPPSPPATQTSTENPPSSDPPVPGSTRLVDNPLGPDASFDNFTTSRPAVPVASHQFVGDRVYVKLGRLDGEVLFLGRVAPDRDFDVPVHLPLVESALVYEIFSDSAADEIVFGEITL